MRIERSRAPTPPVGALAGTIAVAGVGLVALWRQRGWPLPDCAFRDVSGIPCPTCGTVRLIEALTAGDVVGAAAASPLVFAALLAVGTWAAASAGRWALGLPAWRPVLTRAERWCLAGLVVVAVGAGWAYGIWRGG